MTIKIRFASQDSKKKTLRKLRVRYPTESDDLLLQDLLDADGGLPARLVVVGIHAVATSVAHDRIGRDQRAAGGAGDLGLSLRLRRLLSRGFLLQAVPAGITHDGVRRNHRTARLTRGLRFLAFRVDDGLRSRLQDRGRGWSRGPRLDGGRRRLGGLRSHWSHGLRDRCGALGDRRRRDGCRGCALRGLLVGQDLLLPLKESARFFRDLRPRRGEVLLLRSQLPLAVHKLAVPGDLGLEGRLLLFEERDDLFLPRRDLVLAGGDLLHVDRGVCVPASEFLLAPYEAVEALREFLFSSEDLVLLLQDPLLGGFELGLLLLDDPFVLLELLLPGAKALLPADEGVPLIHEGGPFLLESAAVLFQFGG